MSRIETWLMHLEARLKAVFEGEAARGGIPRPLRSHLLQGLVQAMRAGVNYSNPGNDHDDWVYTAPDQYTLILPTAQAQLLLSHPAELDWLTRKLVAFAAQDNILFTAPPLLRVVADPQTSDAQVICSQKKVDPGHSSTLELDGLPPDGGAASSVKLPNAFLIVNGLSTFRLDQVVINIGSDPNNQLVLEDPGVSHWHAQLRFTNGHFVIFDLDSKQGIFINGVVVSNRVLSPGDVIKLAGVPLVYGEETASTHGYTQEVAAGPPPPEVL